MANFMRGNEFRQRIAEKMMFLLLLIAMAGYLCCGLQIYADWFDYIDYFINCCPTFCIFAWLVSEHWGMVAKRSLVALVGFNIINLVYVGLDRDFYYHFFYLMIIYSMTLTMIYSFYEHKLRRHQSNIRRR